MADLAKYSDITAMSGIVANGSLGANQAYNPGRVRRPKLDQKVPFCYYIYIYIYILGASPGEHTYTLYGVHLLCWCMSYNDEYRFSISS